ncbi:hypothetical protein [Oleiharenicola lentus]|uniref:hypothetical protein n=1 Tax=Oleiharenicola lentus TaxID=2508720 RepID=UPI003F6712B6
MQTSLRVTVLFLLLSMPALAAKWMRLESPHFTMLSDASENASRELLEELENFRFAFLKFTGVEPVMPIRPTVVLFGSEAEFQRYVPLYNGKKKRGVAGYFRGTEVNAFVVLSLGANSDHAKSVIYHEYVHSLYHEIDWKPPLWFNEGTAELFSTFETKRGFSFLGKAPPWTVAQLRQTRLMPLSQLFSINTASADYHQDGLARSLFYAQSWGLAHFLICNQNQNWRQQLNHYLATEGVSGMSDVNQFASAMGVSIPQLEKLLNDHVYSGGYSVFKDAFVDRGLKEKITVRPATPVEQECILGVVDATNQPAGQAAFALIRLQERYPREALAFEMDAMLALSEGDERRAGDKLRRVVEMGSASARVHWFLAEDLIKRWLTEQISARKRIGESTATELRLLLHQVTKLSPSSLEAWEALARTEAFSPEPEASTLIEIERQALRSPNDPLAAQMRMLVGFGWKRKGDQEKARVITNAVAESFVAAKSTKTLNRLLMGELLTDANRLR